MITKWKAPSTSSPRMPVRAPFALRKIEPWQRRFILRVHLAVPVCLLLILTLVVTGCAADRSQGTRLVEVGILGAETLAEYYDALIQDTVDTLEIETFVAGLANRSIEAQQRLLEDQINALNYRKRFANSLAGTYAALQELLKIDASEDVRRQVENLVGSLSSIPKLSSGSIDPSNVIGPIAGELAAWRQSRDIRRGVQLVLATLERFSRLFERETEAYTSITQQRANDIGTLVDLVIRVPNVALPRSMRAILDSLELDFSNLPRDPQSGLSAINAFKQLARVRAERRAFASTTAAESISRAIVLLVNVSRAFSDGASPSLAFVRAAWEQAKSNIQRLKQR